jgi:2-iminobutanoate/2-iminopropanoate deaminase
LRISTIVDMVLRGQPLTITGATMHIRAVHTSDAPEAIGPFSQGQILGDLLFSAGQIAIDPATGQFVDGDVTAQTDRVLRNLTAVLQSVGSDWDNVLKTTCFLVNMGDYEQFNAVYARHLGIARPARSTVQVAGLPRGALVEVELVARVPNV